MTDRLNSAGRFLFNRQSADSRLGAILNATAILDQRLNGISGARNIDTVQNINEVTETHKTFFASQYIPGINIAYEYHRSNVKTGFLNFGNGNEITFELPNVGQQFIGDMVLNLQIGAYGVEGGTTHYRYCDYPGVRMIKTTTFTYDNVDIDIYSADDIMFERRFHIPPEVRNAWDAGMGQEVPNEATIYYDDQQVREKRVILDGPQTHKSRQPMLDLWIKLHFDFNQGIASAFFINQLSAGKREVRFEFEDISKIFYTQTGNVIAGATNGPSIIKAQLYTQNIYVPDKIADLYSQTAAFRVLHSYKSLSRSIVDAESNFKLEQLRYPTETVRFGFRPYENLAHPENWHRFTKISTLSIPVPVSLSNGSNPPILARANIEMKRESDMFTTIDLSIKTDKKIYPELPPSFYHSHLQTRYGILHAPDDRGSMAVAFNVARGEANEANGFLDLSIGDPLTLTWRSSDAVINTTSPVELVISNKILKIMIMKTGRSPVFAQAESIVNPVKPVV